MNNEVYTFLETSLLIHQKYHSFMVVQICLLSIFHQIWDPQSKVFNHVLPTPTMFRSPHNFNTSKFLRSPSTSIIDCIYVYIYIIPLPLQKIYESTTSLRGDEDDSTPLHSTVPSTSPRTDSCPREERIDWLVTFGVVELVELVNV